ncbi:Ubiquitin family protein [Reticulomyxa filosa]|uniref:Ubiquitin family protein n=1 Tax=Reticulomyxa filosa TaxID=46433 RepID=X6NTQ0_RETFI|nr:Ubiquitin family protein [Reticulomyxa filosa]|eukprot:ETO28672.1 Ubiquitin family protein [Reticulomyxa filosa]
MEDITSTDETTDGSVVGITVSIKQLDGTTFNVEIRSNATVGDLKQAIERARSIAPERQRLIYRAQELKNDTTALTDYGVVDQSTLHMVIRPLTSVPPNNYNANPNPEAVIHVPQDSVGGYDDINPYMYDHANEGMDGRGIHQNGHDVNVLQMVKLCRFVRIFAIMDFIFLVLFGLTLSFVFFLMAALALAGYYGAKMLRRSYLAAYMVCLVLEIALRAFFIYWYGQSTVSVILFILMIFIELFVLKCVIQLFKAIPYFDAQQRDHILVLNRVGLF